MRTLIAITVILLTGLGQAYAVPADNGIWQKGNLFYQQKQYDSAAFYYEQLAAQKPRNADIYYNLGNTYYRLNKVALAILNYERTLKMNPDHRQAKENLMLAQERISNRIHGSEPIFFIRWWDSITRPGLATVWSIIALVTFSLFVLLFYLRRYSGAYSGRVPVQLLGILAFVFCLLLILSISAANNSTSDSTAVVMQNDAPLMNKELKGKPLLLIPEGTTVNIRTEREGWLEISLPDGRTGWVKQNLVSRI
ncbi:MAG: hypothetical protein K0Q79_1145 [Flavipsychrobacter sp.]|jgi:hypothetical protein|nr:hypothetical protein [Flavipsychrobacter sp.]